MFRSSVLAGLLCACLAGWAVLSPESRGDSSAAAPASQPTTAASAKEISLDLGDGVTLKLVRIEPGKYLRGSPAAEAWRDDDETQHEVELTKGFYLGVHEVTQAQWKAVMGDSPSRRVDNDRLPVEMVSWNDAVKFCQKLSAKTGRRFRLPTEAEWEYACRAGTKTPFHTGNTLSTDEANYNGKSPYVGGAKGVDRQGTTPVGSFKPNAWGLYDMHGNVWEWCSDRWGEYPKGPVKDPAGASEGINRVIRGGSGGDGAVNCRSAYRIWLAPDDKFESLGFRVVLDF